MSRQRHALVLGKGIATVLAAGLLTGCVYDSLQHTDRVSFSTGDAVRANLERETTQPTADYMYDTSGLGADGIVTPREEALPEL